MFGTCDVGKFATAKGRLTDSHVEARRYIATAVTENASTT